MRAPGAVDFERLRWYDDLLAAAWWDFRNPACGRIGRRSAVSPMSRDRCSSCGIVFGAGRAIARKNGCESAQLRPARLRAFRVAAGLGAGD